jgi:hypothetical protein
VFLFLGAEPPGGGEVGAAQVRQHLAVGCDGGKLPAEDRVEDLHVPFLFAAAG